MFRNLVRLVFSILRGLFPWMLRFFRMMFFLTITSITSIYVGIPKSIDRIADNWIEEATAAGLPLGYHPALRTGAKIVASITLILGWLVLASLTIFIIRLFFFN